jgi:hypothetical protein
VTGTVPNKSLLPTEDAGLIEEQLTVPTPTATPFTTWQEAQQHQKNNKTHSPPDENQESDFQQNITVMICQLTGMRATANCPNKQPKTFVEGEQPKEFCPFHVNPPK